MLRYAAILLSATTLASAIPLGAQEVPKPRPTTDRPPKPAGVSAAQQPDSRIRVVWRAVDGAARYKLVRSVPPDGSKTIVLPNPSDTQYVDVDVKPGSTYYYLVSALNEAGMEGLKAGTAPVTAAPVVAPVDTTPPLQPVPPATNVAAKMYDYLRPKVTWTMSIPGARVVIDRREQINGMVAGTATWQPAVTLVKQSWPCSAECSFIDERPLKASALLQYRVTIVEPEPSTRRSEPVTTNSVFVEHIPVAPTEIHQIWLVKGQSHQLSYRPGVAGVQYVSMDSNTVSVPRPHHGVVMAKEFGSTYITATERNPQDGSIKLWIWQVWVSDKPQ